MITVILLCKVPSNDDHSSGKNIDKRKSTTVQNLGDKGNEIISENLCLSQICDEYPLSMLAIYTEIAWIS